MSNCGINTRVRIFHCKYIGASLRAILRAMAFVALAWSCGAVETSVAASSAGGDGDRPLPCTLDFPADPRDYRLRDSTADMRWNYNDNWNNHTSKLVSYVRAADFTRNARAEIEWTLYRWPNHLVALQAAIEYELKGGRPYEFRPMECYFIRARAFVPNDVNVRLAEGLYFWKKGDRARALQVYEEALQAAPDSADAHYNLGLLLVDLKRYDEAVQHAWAAYGAGFPLPGLRNKLVKAGYWKDPPQATAAPARP